MSDSQIPLLILSDSPSGTTGLGRITRELALRIHDNLGDKFRVGCLGHHGFKHSRSLPFYQRRIERIDNWAILDLLECWAEFAGDEHGVLMTICNGTWVEWLTNPTLVRDDALRNFLLRKPFDLWGYFPVDGVSINDQLPLSETQTIQAFDRRLAYTRWGAEVIDKSIETEFSVRGVTPDLPHGTDREFWSPMDRTEARSRFMTEVIGHPVGTPPLRNGLLLLNCINTNSARKDWPLAIETLRELVNLGHDAALWIHTHKAQAYWDIPQMCRAWGMERRVILTETSLTDGQIRLGMAASDCSLANGSGEGWGLSISSSLALGVPVVHGRYAGATDFVPEYMLVEPMGWHWDAFHCVKRPIFSPEWWAKRVESLIENKVVARLPEYIYWDQCWPRWQQWFEQGAEEFHRAR